MNETIDEAKTTQRIETLWSNDTGDMTVEERDALAALVTMPFVTTGSTLRSNPAKTVIQVIAADEREGGRIRRDLDNLGRELILDERLGVAYARQRDEVEAAGMRRTARRRTVRENATRGLVDADILYMAIKLRNRFDEERDRNVTSVRVSEDELFQWFKGSPSAKANDGRAESMRTAFDRCIAALKNSTSGIGLIAKIQAQPAYTILPTVLILVNDQFARTIADTTDEKNGDEDNGEAQLDA